MTDAEIRRALNEAIRGEYRCGPGRLKKIILSGGSNIYESAKCLTLQRHAHDRWGTGRLQSAFIRHCDQLMLSAQREHPVIRERVFSLYLHAFLPLIRNDRQARAHCPVVRDRESAFGMAMAKFERMARRPDFVLQHRARALFKKIFREECVSSTRKATSQKAEMHRSCRQHALDTLGPALARLLTVPPANLEGYDLEQLRQAHPWCFKLCADFTLMGFSYRVLAARYGIPADILRKVKMPRCRKQLRDLYRRMTA